jgi:hypothetical protein
MEATVRATHLYWIHGIDKLSMMDKEQHMVMPRDEIQSEIVKAWQIYLQALEKSLNILEKDIEEAKNMAGICTSEWCQATEHVIDELNNSLFSISEPRWADPEDTKKLKTLKRRIYDLYVNYRGVYAKVF